MTPEAQAAAMEKEAMQEANGLLTQAKAVVITNDEEYRFAGEQFARIKAKEKELEAQRVAITGPMNASLKAVNAMFKRPAEALEAARGYFARPMAKYQEEVEKKRQEAAAAAQRETERLQREARQREQEERDRLVEIQRQEDEARRLATKAENPMAAFLAKQKVEELTAAATKQAEAVRDSIREAVTIQAPVDYIPKATAAGTSARTNWKFRIVNVDLIPRNYMTPNEPEIGAMVRMLKDKDKAEATIPGIEVFSEISIGGR
jgi:colicin import membrane protein